ncbi:MAG: sorbosone dehydrogenase family protein, partial [Pseudomonadota bacterium]|nr:sorbosone dehydrogenase family protein [Pseudomonadota bacterium]
MKPRTTLSLLACILIAGCANDQDIDKSTQYGPSPKLPQPARELLPRMNIAKVVGWASGETPTVPQGFRIEAIATGLSSPRNVYPLANGDLLIIESKKEGREPAERPKRPVMSWMQSKAHG